MCSAPKAASAKAQGAAQASTVEGAWRAVTARILDAIPRVKAVHPEFGAHLNPFGDHRTGCRYDPVEPQV